MITSAQVAPATLASWVQGHWAVENKLHYVRDVALAEDASRVRTGHAPQIMATLRNTAISLLRLTGVQNITEAPRHHARRPDKIIMLLTSTNGTLPCCSHRMTSSSRFRQSGSCRRPRSLVATAGPRP